MKTFYEVLGVSRRATQEEIESAYNRRLCQAQTDKSCNIVDVRMGYDILSDPKRRIVYDRWVLEQLDKENWELRKKLYEAAHKEEEQQGKKKSGAPTTIIFVGIAIIFVFGIGLLAVHSGEPIRRNTTPAKTEEVHAEEEAEEEFMSEEIPDKPIVKSEEEIRRDVYYGIFVEDKNAYNIDYEAFLKELKDAEKLEYYYNLSKKTGRLYTKDEFCKLFGVENIPVPSKAKNASNNATERTNTAKEPIEDNAYEETIYKTGDSPYSNYFGRGRYDSNSLSKLVVENYSDANAVVLLENSSGVVIRNVYVEKGEKYTLNRIPEGIYQTKVMYGNSWYSEKNNGANFPKGGFMRDERFSKSEEGLFKYIFEETYDGVSYPSYSITLHRVLNGNMETKPISKSEFF